MKMKKTIALLLCVMALGACGGGSLGNACTVNDDCDNGQSCFTEAPGGYCSKTCGIEGKTEECPGDSICAQHSGKLLCSDTCQVKEDCRADYECNGVTGTAVKACRPKA